MTKRMRLGKPQRQIQQTKNIQEIKNTLYTHTVRAKPQKEMVQKKVIFIHCLLQKHIHTFVFCFCIVLLLLAADLAHIPIEMLISLFMSPKLPYLIKIIFSIYPVLQHALYPFQFWQLHDSSTSENSITSSLASRLLKKNTQQYQTQKRPSQGSPIPFFFYFFFFSIANSVARFFEI